MGKSRGSMYHSGGRNDVALFSVVEVFLFSSLFLATTAHRLVKNPETN
jgi:hypothetical protein